ncbi:uncharacterized protein LOC118188545 [Stegodyphus dumicola]|uniref:uncharacterized protein LOC118188545 n=1 Tax=Stegodyphus dumicola TaxID=202533 RepID=UPI0015AB8CD4|nr:uncharacterized protein LOC118188545 [Stegodyphus dumicola]
MTWTVIQDEVTSDHKLISYGFVAQTVAITTKRFKTTNNRIKRFVNSISTEVPLIINELKNFTNEVQLDDLTTKLTKSIQAHCEKSFDIKNPSDIKKVNWWTTSLRSERNKTRALKRRMKQAKTEADRTAAYIIFAKQRAFYKKINSICKNKLLEKIHIKQQRPLWSDVQNLRKVFKPSQIIIPHSVLHTSLSVSHESEDATTTAIEKIMEAVFLNDVAEGDTAAQRSRRENTQHPCTQDDAPFAEFEINNIIKNLPKKKSSRSRRDR